MAQTTYKNLVINYRQNTEDEAVLNHSFEKDIFYRAIPDVKLRPDSTIIDVGAHIGTFSLYSNYLAPYGKIYAIEANFDTYIILESNIRNNNINNIIPLNYALSDNDGEIKLFISKENWEHSITKQFSDTYEVVKSICLKSLFEKYSVKQCDLIKFNCEGAEFQIIFNTPKEIIQKFKFLLILFHEDMVSNPNFTKKNLVDFLKINGFNIRVMNSSKGRGWIIAKNKEYYGIFSNFNYIFLSYSKKIYNRVSRFFK